MFHEARSGFTSFTVHKLTFREDKDRASSKVEETSQTDAPSAQPKRPPPGNTDPALGRVDWDEIEAENIQLGLRRALRNMGIKPPGE